jgi:hypothetical protein
MDCWLREREVTRNLRAIVKQTLSLQCVRTSQQSSSASEMESDESAPQPSLWHSPSRDFSGTDIQDTDFVLLQSSASPSYTVSDVSSNVKTFDFSDRQNAKESPKHPTPAAAAIGVAPCNKTIDMTLTNGSWSVPTV